MAHEAPGKHYRKTISLPRLFRMFPDDETARTWIESIVWPDGPRCPHCGSDNVQCNIKHHSMTHRCRDCADKPRFSVKTGTVMQSSKLGYQTWAIAAYLVTTSLKGVSSMKLHRDLEITQKSAWHLAHRLRKTYEAGLPLFTGPAEADETYMGGKRKNMPKSKRDDMTGRGAVGKEIVAGVKDRETNAVVARTVESTDKATLQGFVAETVAPGSDLYTDDHKGYQGIEGFHHESVKHSSGEYVKGLVHTNGIESFWSMFKRGYKGTYHKMSPKHLQRYINEFAGRHNMREGDTIQQLELTVERMQGKRLTYAALKADNGLDSGARAE